MYVIPKVRSHKIGFACPEVWVLKETWREDSSSSLSSWKWLCGLSQPSRCLVQRKTGSWDPCGHPCQAAWPQDAFCPKCGPDFFLILAKLCQVQQYPCAQLDDWCRTRVYSTSYPLVGSIWMDWNKAINIKYIYMWL